jgi:hypothetical protein
MAFDFAARTLLSAAFDFDLGRPDEWHINQPYRETLGGTALQSVREKCRPSQNEGLSNEGSIQSRRYPMIT